MNKFKIALIAVVTKTGDVCLRTPGDIKDSEKEIEGKTPYEAWNNFSREMWKVETHLVQFNDNFAIYEDEKRKMMFQITQFRF